MEMTLPSSHLPQPKTVLLQPGETFVCAGEPLKGVLTVLSGRLKRKRPYPTGEYLVGIAAAGDRLGTFEAISGHAHPETLEAIGRVEIQVEPVASFLMKLRAMPLELRQSLEAAALSQVGARPFGDWMLETANMRLSVGARARLRRPLDLLPVRSRVAATIWILKSLYGEKTSQGTVLDLDLTREEIAHLASTVYESVIRTLTKFKKDGLIHLEGRKIWILDEVQLARAAQIVVGTGAYDKETILENYSPQNNRRSQEAS